jgi:hypothetical protein
MGTKMSRQPAQLKAKFLSLISRPEGALQTLAGRGWHPPRQELGRKRTEFLCYDGQVEEWNHEGRGGGFALQIDNVRLK